jgi:toxin CptA
MSIAVSAVVHPSRILFALNVAMALIAVCVSLAIGAGQIGDLPTLLRALLSALVFFLASFGFYHGMRCRKTIQLDISGTGQIRLLNAGVKPSCSATIRPHVREIGEVVRLMDNSTIWPYMLLLRLRSDAGRTTVVPVFPDSVDREAFRALSIACRWISVQNETQHPEIF